MTHPIIKSAKVQLRAADPQARSAAPRLMRDASDCAAPGEKAVRLLREDGDVRALELTCSCGEVTVIELSYPDEPSA